MKVKRGGDERILKRLEDMGFKLKFGYDYTYVNIPQRKGKFKSYVSGFFKEEGEECEKPYMFDTEEEALNITFSRLKLNSNYPIHIRKASLSEYETKYCTYLRIFNNKL